MPDHHNILTIDYGNSFSKLALFDGDNLVNFWPRTPSNAIREIIASCDYEKIVVCSVSKTKTEILDDLKIGAGQVIFFDSFENLPIGIHYDTPHTLGPDRVAAAMGAARIYSNDSCLIVDMGTCIKYDLLKDGNTFEGGIIAPGLKMRFKAMHEFTKKLPLITEIEPWPALLGKSTHAAMQSGVLNGILAEMEGIIGQYGQFLTKFKIILTGGDAQMFAVRLKYPNFVVPELVNIGLYHFYKHQINS